MLLRLFFDDLARFNRMVTKILILEVYMKRFVVLLAILFTLFIGCSKDKSTQPPAQQGTLLLNRLVVSMVPGRSETVAIKATDANGSFCECTFTNSNPSVASATITDSTLNVTGLSYGTANLTISNGSGLSCNLPVQVYNYQTLDTGELLVTNTDSFAGILPQFYGGEFWKPIPPEGFVALSSFISSDATDPNGEKAVMVVKAKAGSNAIAFADSFSHDPYLPPAWEPVPPVGYMAMGTVIAENRPDSVACLREDLVTRGQLTFLWAYSNHYSAWRITQPNAEAHDHAYLEPGTFLFVRGNSEPGDHPALNVLKVDLPMLDEAPVQDFIPQLTNYDQPPDETMPRMEKAMLVPCSIVYDLNCPGNFHWQVANSPFYRLERHVIYKRIYYNYNTTGQLQTNSVDITSGLTTDSSTTIWQNTGIELSVSAGVSFKAVSGSITATVSQQFGYETQTSVQELFSRTVHTSINIPAHKAAAAWQRYNRYILYRHSGTELQVVRSWEFGIDSYVVDEYPD
jgi:hypothetical protein